MPAAVFDNYGFTYALGGKPALTGINLKIERGEILTLCGASGSGKSTLLRCLKKAANPAGKHSGSLTAIDDKDIAIVFQNPETQLVMTTVIDDLVFQMENRCVPEKQMKKRVSETAAFFGIEPWLHKRVDELSGGQKQMTALCAALMCEPRLLLLDEPIAQLDPLAGAALLETVRNLNRELGVTVVMAEHRLDECAAVSDRIAFLQDGKLVYAGEVREALRYLHSGGFADYVPPLPKASLTIDGGCVLTPREFSERYPTAPKKINDSEGKAAQPSAGLRQRRKSESSGFQSRKNAKNFLVNITDLSAGYPSDKLPVLRRLDFTAARGETVCLLGGNGSGKSTLLKVIAKIIKPVMGKARANGKVGYMPQYARDYFLRERVRDEIVDWDSPQMKALAGKLSISHLCEANPFDLSGGEQQKCVLAAILSRKPDILLLDEPTKGIDPSAKKALGTLLNEFTASGGTVITATHDFEFAAEYASRCAMLFDGEIVCEDTPRGFFADNRFYTTAIHKGLRHIDARAVFQDDVSILWAR